MNANEKADRAEGRRRIYLMRHGDVSYFAADGRPFRPDIVPLNDEGRRQAAAAAQALADVTFERVASSDLPRCVETAAIVAGSRQAPVTILPALREIRPGRLAEIPVEKMEQSFVGAFTECIGRDTRFLGGESFGSLQDRVMRALAELLADQSWRSLLLVAHGGVNRTLLCHALGADLNGFAALEQDPACINILDVDAMGKWVVRLVNYTPYNPVKNGMQRTTMGRLFDEYLRTRPPMQAT
jgi:broad specificity phosphatase PhoE